MGIRSLSSPGGPAREPSLLRFARAVSHSLSGSVSGRGPVTRFALLTDVSLEPSVLIESSWFGNNRARGTLIKSSNVIVRNSSYHYT